MTKLVVQWVKCGPTRSKDDLLAKVEIYADDTEGATAFREAVHTIRLFDLNHRFLRETGADDEPWGANMEMPKPS